MMYRFSTYFYVKKYLQGAGPHRRTRSCTTGARSWTTVSARSRTSGAGSRSSDSRSKTTSARIRITSARSQITSYYYSPALLYLKNHKAFMNSFEEQILYLQTHEYNRSYNLNELECIIFYCMQKWNPDQGMHT